MISGLAHVNMLVPPGTLNLAEQFYGDTLGLKPEPGPEKQKDSLRWFGVGNSGQQVHIAFGNDDARSSRHPCFKVESLEALLKLRQNIYDHFERGGDAAPQEADKPGEENSGAQGAEYPSRFFARDYAGNRLEFSL